MMTVLSSFFSTRRAIAAAAIVLMMGSASAGGYRWYSDSQVASVSAAYKTSEENDVYVRFDMEIFDIIIKEYWQKASEKDLAELYRLALVKAAGVTEETLPTADRSGTARMVQDAIQRTPEDKRKALAVDLGIIVLSNLAPQGRSGLLSEKQEQQFRDTANNVDRSKNLYKDLAIEEGASVGDVAKAYEEKKVELESIETPEAKDELKKAEYAQKVLTDATTKVVYDETKIEPTLVSRVMGSTLYVNLSQVSPATFNEFVSTLQKTAGHSDLTTLILDVRGNIGGTLDFSKYLLALFIGPNQYAFDLFHQGEMRVERTPAIAKIDSLQNVKEIAILTDAMSQSTAELTAAIFQRFNMAKVVGEKTRGWGTVENTFPIQTVLDESERPTVEGGKLVVVDHTEASRPNVKYSVLLVHSLTLRPDNEPIETRGIDPDVDTNSKNWRAQLSKEFKSASLIQAIIELM